MNKKTHKTDAEDVIKQLQGLVVKIDYSDSPRLHRRKEVQESKIVDLAKKVSKHLADDPLPTTHPL